MFTKLSTIAICSTSTVHTVRLLLQNPMLNGFHRNRCVRLRSPHPIKSCSPVSYSRLPVCSWIRHLRTPLRHGKTLTCTNCRPMLPVAPSGKLLLVNTVVPQCELALDPCCHHFMEGHFPLPLAITTPYLRISYRAEHYGQCRPWLLSLLIVVLAFYFHANPAS
jgi:hypothetical protein